MKTRWLAFVCTGLIVTALAAIVACGDDENGSGEGTPTAVLSPTPSEPASTPTEAATSTPTSTPTEEPFSGGRDPVEREDPEVPPIAVQTDLRYAAHEDYDRVVFDFIDNTPGFRIAYVEPPILADGSGNIVEINGDAFLEVRFSTAQAHDEQGNLTIDELEVMPGLSSIVEIEQTGDFEGYVTWVLGLPEQVDFRVFVLEDPIRVVVDVGHP